MRVKTNQKIHIAAFCCLLLILCVPAGSLQAQQPQKGARVGFLSHADKDTGFARFDEMRSALRGLGYLEGQNITFEYRNSDGDAGRLPSLASNLVQLNLNLITVGSGLPALQVIKRSTTTIPIVMTDHGIDPEVSGLVESL